MFSLVCFALASRCSSVSAVRTPPASGSTPSAVRSRARFSASSSVKNSFPARFGGRCNGVNVAIVHTPCRSGRPSGIRGTFVEEPDGLDEADGLDVWPATTAGVNHVAAATVSVAARNRWLTVPPRLFGRIEGLDPSVPRATGLLSTHPSYAMIKPGNGSGACSHASVALRHQELELLPFTNLERPFERSPPGIYQRSVSARPHAVDAKRAVPVGHRTVRRRRCDDPGPHALVHVAPHVIHTFPLERVHKHAALRQNDVENPLVDVPLPIPLPHTHVVQHVIVVPEIGGLAGSNHQHPRREGVCNLVHHRAGRLGRVLPRGLRL